MFIRQLYGQGGKSSTVVCIPPRYLKALHAQQGDIVKIELNKYNQIVISKLIVNAPEGTEITTGR